MPHERVNRHPMTASDCSGNQCLRTDSSHSLILLCNFALSLSIRKQRHSLSEPSHVSYSTHAITSGGGCRCRHIWRGVRSRRELMRSIYHHFYLQNEKWQKRGVHFSFKGCHTGERLIPHVQNKLKNKNKTKTICFVVGQWHPVKDKSFCHFSSTAVGGWNTTQVLVQKQEKHGGKDWSGRIKEYYYAINDWCT